MNNNKLYKLLDWSKINKIIYSECDNPHEILGPHVFGNHVLFQFFYPGAVSAKLRIMNSRKDHPMQMISEEGYFALLLPSKDMGEYHYVVKDGLNKELLILDAYRHEPLITTKDTNKFKNGIHYEIYNKLGAHPCELDGDDGTYFAVWAPNAMRVSVVGDFNRWDGRAHQMRRLWDSGIFEVFVPQAMVGMNYKFEIKTASGLTYLKADPYANYSELRPNSASVIEDIEDFIWKDDKFIANRHLFQNLNAPINVFELYLGTFCEGKNENSYPNYRNIAPKLIEYVKKMNYTHVQLMPIMEHPYDASWGYQVIGYYAPTSRYGTPDDFMYFVNELHKAGIGVIMDWVPAHFPKDGHGLSDFDGTCLYEHLDPRQSEQVFWGTKIFNYSRPEVSNYLLANALFWIEKYHIDGLHVGAVASMLYLDYGKSEGEWIANIYGGNENLDAKEFLKHLNSIIKKRNPGVITIAEDISAYPLVTADLSEGGLGFDLKWNSSFTNDYFKFIGYDTSVRYQNQNELLFSTIYAYSENFILPFSHDDVVHGKGSVAFKMPGNIEEKFANLRLTMAYRMMHPGKKLVFMGQDMGEMDEWNEKKILKWNLLDYPMHKGINSLCKDLNALYKEDDALYYYDVSKEGFEWINAIATENTCLSFVRKGKEEHECLLITINLSDKGKTFRMGVPYAGEAYELINTDQKKYGGSGVSNQGTLITENITCDDKTYSLELTLAPCSLAILRLKKID